MSFPQLGYPQYLYSVGAAAADRQLLAPSAVSPASPPSAASSRAASCDVAGSACAVTSLLAAGAGGAGGVYAHPYGYGAFLPYTSAAELALFSQMGSQYDLKDSPGVSFAAHASPAAFYPYAGFQYGDASRPKNATRESTSTLKAWLNEHRKNPYPTKGEKIMLAIITKMTLTQVSTWFANARRRLKKENKVTWGARAKSEDEDEEEGARAERKEEEEEEDDDKHADNGDASAEDEGISLHVDSLTDHSAESDGEKVLCRIDDFSCKPAPETKEKHSEIDLTSPHGGHGRLSPKPMTSSPLTGVEAQLLDTHRDKNKSCADVQSQNTKPKLWSLAEIATSDPKQPLQSQNCPSGGGIWTSSQSGAAPSASILARPIYYTSTFYSNYGNYGNFGQGILRYGSIHKHTPETAMLKANHANHFQAEQHFRALSTEAKKDSGDACTLGPHSYLSS